MLKISRTQEGSAVVLHAEGRAVAEWVAELRASCEAAFAEGHRLELNLLQVDYADRAGLILLRDVKMRGAVLRCSPFLTEQLKTISL